jgi:hypothetical protein
MEERKKRAHAAAASLSKTALEEQYKKENGKKELRLYGGRTNAEAKESVNLKTFRDGLNNGSLGIQNEEFLFPDEEGYLQDALAYVQGKLPHPPLFFQLAADGHALDAHDLVIARLEATSSALSYKANPHITYRIFNQNEREIAEAMGSLQGDRTFDYIEGGEIPEGKTLSTMTIDEVTDILQKNPDARLGIYRIPASRLLEILEYKTKKFPGYTWSSDQLFDQDFQDGLIMDSLRLNVVNSNSNNVADMTWTINENLSDATIKELNDIYDILKNNTMAQLQNLQPDVAKAFTGVLQGN